MSVTYRLAVLILLLVSLAACSARRVYESPDAIQTLEAININTATADELERLPHIGPKTAKKIIQFREENGPFRRVEHIIQIRGISDKRFREIQPFLKAE